MNPTLTLADILIVDDVPDNLRILSQLLLEHGYRARKATNGYFALNSAQLKPPDLILLDVMMPELDGYEVCRLLKADQRTHQIPVIFITARNDLEGKVAGFKAGGVDYITKPFELEEVLVRVETQLKLSRLQNELQHQRDQLAQKNQQLEQEVSDRIAAQTALQTLNDELEIKVKERTQELNHRNQELSELKKQLEKALEQQQALNEMKSRLITTISHEFRTPLTVIMTSHELIKHKVERQKTQGIERHFNRVNDSVKRIEQILNSAIILAQFDSNLLHFEQQPINLKLWLTNIINESFPPTPDFNSLHVVTHGNPPEHFICDPNFLKEIIVNLINNAVRYSPNGGDILIELTTDPMQVVFRIQDHGIGIPEDELEQVFEPFYRANNADSISGTPGAGFGLTVVQRLVELHQGKVTLESILNQGTTVTVTLPIKN